MILIRYIINDDEHVFLLYLISDIERAGHPFVALVGSVIQLFPAKTSLSSLFFSTEPAVVCQFFKSLDLASTAFQW